jgi:hypothetical protein
VAEGNDWLRISHLGEVAHFVAEGARSMEGERCLGGNMIQREGSMPIGSEGRRTEITRHNSLIYILLCLFPVVKL